MAISSLLCAPEITPMEDLNPDAVLADIVAASIQNMLANLGLDYVDSLVLQGPWAVYK